MKGEKKEEEKTSAVLEKAAIVSKWKNRTEYLVSDKAWGFADRCESSDVQPTIL